MNEYNPTEAEELAIKTLEEEKKEWEDGIVWVTDKVAFKTTQTVKKSRKNYFGIFDEEKDPTTNRRKLFIPLTEWTVEMILKNIDIDTKDINLKAKNPRAYRKTKIARYVLRYFLDKMHFGKILNDKLRNTSIDGTCYDKTWKENGKVMHKNIDRLNILTDPSETDLTDTSTIIERNLLTLPEFKAYKWDNSQHVEGSKEIDRVGIDNKTNSQVPFVEVYERYGYISKFCLTGNQEDRNEYLYCLLVLSGLDEKPVLHKIKEVKTHPYVKYKLKDVLNRADGRGIPEMLFNIQAYLNETINIRLNTARIVQSGLWKAQGNITPQDLKKFFATGVIKLDSASEFERLDTGSIDPSSYKDEEQAYTWGKRVTQTQAEDEIANSKPATNAIIEERGGAKSYNLIIENIASSIERLIEDKLIPLIKETIKDGDIIRITGDPSDLKELDRQLGEELVYKEMEKYKKKNGFYPYMTLEEMEAQIDQVTIELANMGEDRPLELSKSLFDTEFDIQVSISDEQMNKAVVANTLNQSINILAGAGVPPAMLKEPIKELFDTMGLDGDKLTGKIDEAQMMRAKQEEAAIEQGATEAPGAEANSIPQEVNQMPV